MAEAVAHVAHKNVWWIYITWEPCLFVGHLSWKVSRDELLVSLSDYSSSSYDQYICIETRNRELHLYLPSTELLMDV